MDKEKQPSKRKNILIYNLVFVVVCIGLLMFLWNAPEETTKYLPNDAEHVKFLKMNKKEAEKFCEDCHSPEGVYPLPKDHPPKYRCLFCHKRDQ